MSLIFGRLYSVRHREDTTSGGSVDTSGSVCTVKEGPWEGMYHRDLYARDRVMKSARLLLPFLKDGDAVLDVGCFTQEARKYFSRSIQYIGLDSVQYHSQTRVVDLNHGFAPVPAAHALCLETLEHLIDPGDALESIGKSLAPHGVLVVSVPNEATIFHRLRCLCGVVDAQAFSGEGKHLHLPNLKQSRSFVSTHFQILKEKYYIAPSGVGSQQGWVGRILSLFPDSLHQFLADVWPSLFARGFIFLLKKKV